MEGVRKEYTWDHMTNTNLLQMHRSFIGPLKPILGPLFHKHAQCPSRWIPQGFRANDQTKKANHQPPYFFLVLTHKDLLEQCWQASTDHRPTAVQTLQLLDNIEKELFSKCWLSTNHFFFFWFFFCFSEHPQTKPNPSGRDNRKCERNFQEVILEHSSFPLTTLVGGEGGVYQHRESEKEIKNKQK